MTLVLRDGEGDPAWSGTADLGLHAIGQRQLIRNYLESGDHVPVAALGIVSKLLEPRTPP